MKFTKGTKVCTNEQGRRYYDVHDQRSNITGIVVDQAGSVVTVKYGPNRRDTFQMYDNCLEPVAPSDDEVAKAIESIAQTPRRGQ